MGFITTTDRGHLRGYEHILREGLLLSEKITDPDNRATRITYYPSGRAKSITRVDLAKKGSDLI